jgi:hypothetical protein
MLLTSLWAWAIERLAYRPLRGSFRLAPLISAIGMSIFLSNLVQVTQGPRNKPVPSILSDVIMLSSGADGYAITLSYKQILIVVVTAVLLAAFWYVVQKTSLGRAQRACEQDRRMAALLGVDVDRTISLTVRDGSGAGGRRRPHVHDLLRRRALQRRLRAGGQGLHGGRAGRHRLAPRRRSRRPADRPHRDPVVGLLLDRLQGRRHLLDPGVTLVFLPSGLLGKPKWRRCEPMAVDVAAEPRPTASRTIVAASRMRWARRCGARAGGADPGAAHRAEHLQRADPAAALGLRAAIAVLLAFRRGSSISWPRPAEARKARVPPLAGIMGRAISVAGLVCCWPIPLLALALVGRAAPSSGSTISASRS